MKFKVGDLAITQNSEAPLLNNGLLVVVLGVHPGRKTIKWPVDYYIKRVDGQPFGWITGANGEDQLFKACDCWCRADQLRKPEESDLKEESEIQRHPMQGAADAMEAAIRQMGEEMVAQGLARRVPSKSTSVDNQSTGSRFKPNERHN